MSESPWHVARRGNPLSVALRGFELLREPLYNKGSAFTVRERLELGLEGLLPTGVNTMDRQVQKMRNELKKYTDPLAKYVELAELHDRNEQLFYRLLIEDLDSLMPIVYTPTVGQATREFSHVFRRGRGVWITPEHRGRIDDVLRNGAGGRDVRLIVATDNESILGIGDQGAGGMAISTGKLALYCAAAGIPPGATLPVSLDVGTNNVSLLEDSLYLGWPHRRLTGKVYYDLIDEFVQAVSEVFPHALLQWEDFRKNNALTLLDRYRDSLLSFNDDIQGTGAVALAGIIAGLRITGGAIEDQRFVVHGAGAAGLGIARQIRAFVGDRSTHAIAALDSRGLLVANTEFADAYKADLAWPEDVARNRGLDDMAHHDLLSVVQRFRPTVLIGTSGRPGAFDKDIVAAMAEHCEQPIIMPFSNPTDYSEARPEEVIRWSGGRALVATGSPFADVEYEGRVHRIGQGNNVFIFPGLGLGGLLARAKRVTDAMIGAASAALADQVSEEELAAGMLYPRIGRLREVSRQVAAAVMRQAAADGDGDAIDDGEIEARLDAAVWYPDYPDYIAG
jgi:malic enzyme